MKAIKRISTILFAGILAAVLFAVPAYAVATGEVQFSDPEGQVGKEVEVTAKMTCGNQLIGDGKIVIQYDSQMLEFIEGTGARDIKTGSVTLFNAGTGKETELNYSIKFKALKEGETEITVVNTESYLWNDRTLKLECGSSKVKITKGGASDGEGGTVEGNGPAVTIDGKEYKIVNDIPPTVIPQGWSEDTMEFNNQKVNCIKQDVSGQQALYLTDDKEAAMFLYDDEDGSLQYMEVVQISDTAYIILLQDDGTVKVPKSFKKVTLKYNDHDFPAWQNPGYEDYYLVYGLNSEGDKDLYLYDNTEETFQRFNPDLLKEKKTAKQKRPGWEGKVLDFIEDHMKPCLIGAAGLIFLMLILLLIQALKIRSRNIEIDDLYEDLDGKRSPAAAPKKGKKGKKSKKKAKKAKKNKGGRRSSGIYDDYDDYDDYPMEEDLFGDERFDDYEYDNDFGLEDDEDDFFDTAAQPLTDTLSNHKLIDADLDYSRPARRPARSESNAKFHVDADDTFKLDFVDLDLDD